MATAPVLKAFTELTAPRPGTPSLRGIDHGLVFDFDPSTLVQADASPVTSLKSKRGKLGAAATLGAASPAGLPSYRSDEATEGLSFNGSHGLRTPIWNATYGAPFTVAVVARATSVANSGNLYSGVTHPTLGLGYATANFAGIGLGATAQLRWDQPLNNGQYYLFTAVFNGANSVAQVNNLTPRIGPTGGGANAFIPGFTFGTNASASGTFLNGRILRAVAWDRALNDSERAMLAEKLMAEYDL